MTITAHGDNEYTGTETVELTGKASIDDVTVTKAELKVTDNDIPPGRVRLNLEPRRIQESGTITSTDVTATIVGEAHDQEITVTVTADSPDAIQGTLMMTAWLLSGR